MKTHPGLYTEFLR